MNLLHNNFNKYTIELYSYSYLQSSVYMNNFAFCCKSTDISVLKGVIVLFTSSSTVQYFLIKLRIAASGAQSAPVRAAQPLEDLFVGNRAVRVGVDGLQRVHDRLLRLLHRHHLQLAALFLRLF